MPNYWNRSIARQAIVLTFYKWYWYWRLVKHLFIFPVTSLSPEEIMEWDGTSTYYFFVCEGRHCSINFHSESTQWINSILQIYRNPCAFEEAQCFSHRILSRHLSMDSSSPACACVESCTEVREEMGAIGWPYCSITHSGRWMGESSEWVWQRFRTWPLRNRIGRRCLCIIHIFQNIMSVNGTY